jgi:hypothetical protein
VKTGKSQKSADLLIDDQLSLQFSPEKFNMSASVGTVLTSEQVVGTATDDDFRLDGGGLAPVAVLYSIRLR